MIDFRYRPLPTAQKIHKDPREMVAIVGPWGSGKSTIAAVDLYMHIEKYNCDALIVRDTYPALRDSCVSKWMEMFAPAGEINMGPPPTFYFHGRLKGRKVMFRSAESPEDIGKFQSVECGCAWLEEVCPGLLPGGSLNLGIAPEVLSGVLGRIRKWHTPSGQGQRRMLLSSLPPPTTRHWFHSLFYDRRPLLKGVAESLEAHLTEQVALYKVSPDENLAHLPPNYYEMQTAFLTSEDQVQRFIRGEVGGGYGSAAVYAEQWNDEAHIREVTAIPGPMILGIDGGLDAAAVWMQLQPSGRLAALAELCTNGLGLEDFGYAVIQQGNRLFGSRMYDIWTDPAIFARSQNDGKNGAWYLGKAGLRARPAPQNPDIRISAVRTWLSRMASTGALFQVHPRCEMLIEGFRGAYHWKRSGGVILVGHAEKNEFSHVHDACQYASAALQYRGQQAALPRLPNVDILGKMVPIRQSIVGQRTRRRA